ncbi:MAG: hypothetical protein ACI9YE_001537 [Psychroserpens sp.]|jgi:hypothetical protein
MKKVLVFGDSHIAQLVTANTLIEQTEIDFHFITGPGPVKNKLYFKGRRLYLEENDGVWPGTTIQSNLPNNNFDIWYENTKARFFKIAQNGSIDLGQFDSIIVYGGGLVGDNWYWLMNKDSRFSQSIMLDYLESMILKSAQYLWLKQLGKFIEDGGRVDFMLPPLRNELAFNDEVESSQDLSVMRLTPVDASFLEVETLFQRFIENNGAKMIPLPRNIYSDSGRATHTRYKSDNKLDFGHVNAAGGTLILGSLIHTLTVSR